jgi:hypothetical protein
MCKDNSVYVHVYFRINAGYVWGAGMDKDKVLSFDTEIVGILRGLGFDKWEDWPVRSMSGACPKGWRGVEHLYCHPMDLSGWVKAEAVPVIEEALKHGKTFTLRGIDRFKEAMNYTEEEYTRAMEAKRGELEGKLIEVFTTTRKNRYKSLYEPIVLVPFIKFGYPENPLQGVALGFMLEVVGFLLNSGKLVELKQNGHTYYRAAKCASTRKVARA